jgi:hypothetical protein
MFFFLPNFFFILILHYENNKKSKLNQNITLTHFVKIISNNQIDKIETRRVVRFEGENLSNTNCNPKMLRKY